MKTHTHGNVMTRQMRVDFVNGNELEAVPAADRARLAEMTPATYTDNTAEHAQQIKDLIAKILNFNQKKRSSSFAFLL